MPDPDPEIKEVGVGGGGGVVSKKLFWGLKIRGGGLPDPSPGSAT